MINLVFINKTKQKSNHTGKHEVNHLEYIYVNGFI